MDTATRPEEVNDGTLTSWIPFTTPGPSPDTICSAAIYQMPGESSLLAFDNWYTNIVGEGGVTCLPTEVVKWRAQNTAMVLSLGPFYCPSDYSTATTSSVDGVSTLVGCCPSGYDFKGIGLPAGCISTLTSGAVTAKSVYAPAGSWVSWDDITLSTAGVSVIGIQVQGFIFNSPAPTLTTDTQRTTLLAAVGFNAVNGVTSTPLPGSASSSSRTRPTTTATLQELVSSTQEISSSLPSSVVTNISGTVTTIFPTLTLPSTTYALHSGTSVLSSSSSVPTSSATQTLGLGAKVGIGIGAGVAVVVLGFLIAFLHVLHRRKYTNSPSADAGEKDSAAGVGLGRGRWNRDWVRRRRTNEVCRTSEEEINSGILFQDALPPSFLVERYEVPVSSRDEGPHELDPVSGRLNKSRSSTGVYSWRTDD